MLLGGETVSEILAQYDTWEFRKQFWLSSHRIRKLREILNASGLHCDDLRISWGTVP